MTSGGIDLLASCLLGKVTMENITIICIWSAISHCLIWCIWKEKNAKCFEGLENSISSVKFIFLKSLYEWLSASGQFSFSNLFGLLDLGYFTQYLLCISCVLPVYLGCAPFSLFNECFTYYKLYIYKLFDLIL